jgi:hypothetical protein
LHHPESKNKPVVVIRLTFPGVTTHYLGNFNPTVNPFSIQFTSPQIAVAFGISTNPATTEFTAKLEQKTDDDDQGRAEHSDAVRKG